MKEEASFYDKKEASLRGLQYGTYNTYSTYKREMLPEKVYEKPVGALLCAVWTSCETVVGFGLHGGRFRFARCRDLVCSVACFG